LFLLPLFFFFLFLFFLLLFSLTGLVSVLRDMQ
jgi:hypothetical protein